MPRTPDDHRDGYDPDRYPDERPTRAELLQEALEDEAEERRQVFLDRQLEREGR